MKLARKLVFGLLLGIIVVFAVSAWLRVVREVDLFDRDTQRDDILVGRAIATSVRRTWQVEGEAAIREFLRSFNLGSHVQVRWVSLDGKEPGEKPLLDLSLLAPVRAGQELSMRNQALGVQLTYVPLGLAGTSRSGALELSESLAAEAAYVRGSIWAAFVTTGALIVVAGFLTTVLGTLFVGRPVHQLVGKVRRIATGDLGGPVGLERHDELGELASAINQMCDALSAANEEARREAAARVAAIEQLRHADRLTTVGKLASGIAHELGTPLNVVAGRAFMIASNEVDGAEVAENARIIGEQTERMIRIIRQVLDFARPRKVEKIAADLRGLADETAGLLRPMADKRGVQLLVSEGATTGVAVADVGQIRQAVTNLVVNAIHATGNGGTVTIGLSDEMATPPNAVHKAERYLCVSVRDTGQGMDLETQARIFDPFFTTKDVGEGTGLGLSIAYGIVRDHGGWIAVDSRPGRGTTMSIYLPHGIDESAINT
jgi:two-component system NtrC family sensor kinase